ncbi:MAG: AbrB/MazE/SpoVT family DNA-binding domain-containing protein [Oscillospiraceae bacterium]|nr:AbrB/MazE/SpoVT family DNA-binding domain-containing protein [Oscillospiraceae bacterium]
MSIIEMEKYKMKPKIISVSKKRQITLPIEYFKALNISNEVECIIQENCIIIKPVNDNEDTGFSEYILKDLIDEGYEGDKLLSKFKERKSKIRLAAKQLIKEADKIAEDSSPYTTMGDIFDKEG